MSLRRLAALPLALVCALTAAPARAADPPPDPSEEAPPPLLDEPHPPGDAPPADPPDDPSDGRDDDDGADPADGDEQRDDDGDGDDGAGPGAGPAHPPRPDAPSESFFATPFGGSLLGCAIGGGLPALGIGASCGLLALACGCVATTAGAGALVAVIPAVAAIYAGCPSILAIGPCASGGACAGGVTAALLSRRDVLPVLAGASAGGLVAGAALASFVGFVFGYAALNGQPAVQQFMFILPVVGVVLALLAGPAGIGGVALVDVMGLTKPAPPDEKAAPSRRRRAPRVVQAPIAPATMSY